MSNCDIRSSPFRALHGKRIFKFYVALTNKDVPPCQRYLGFLTNTLVIKRKTGEPVPGVRTDGAASVTGNRLV